MDHELKLGAALGKPVEQLLGRDEVGDRMLGDVAPLAAGRVAQAIADHDIQLWVLAEPGDDVRTDEAGAAGDQDDAAAHAQAALVRAS